MLKHLVLVMALPWIHFSWLYCVQVLSFRTLDAIGFDLNVLDFCAFYALNTFADLISMETGAYLCSFSAHCFIGEHSWIWSPCCIVLCFVPASISFCYRHIQQHSTTCISYCTCFAHLILFLRTLSQILGYAVFVLSFFTIRCVWLYLQVTLDNLRV